MIDVRIIVIVYYHVRYIQTIYNKSFTNHYKKTVLRFSVDYLLLVDQKFFQFRLRFTDQSTPKSKVFGGKIQVHPYKLIFHVDLTSISTDPLYISVSVISLQLFPVLERRCYTSGVLISEDAYQCACVLV